MTRQSMLFALAFAAGLLIGCGVSRSPEVNRAEAQQGAGKWEYKFFNLSVTLKQLADAKNPGDDNAVVNKVLDKQLDEISRDNWEYSGYTMVGPTVSMPLFKRPKR
jgi:hypothetical protein